MNEDWDTEMLEPRAGEELERMLDRYARLRLDPSPAEVKRARAALMEAAWRQRLAVPDLAAAQDGDPAPGEAGASTADAARARRRGPFAGWGTRRIGVAVAAAALAGLMVGTTTFAASRAGGPLYDARLALEQLTLPPDAQARLEAELALAQGRLAEILDSVARDDPGAIAAAVRGYGASLDALDGATGGHADRALEAILLHRQVLLGVLGRAPADALAGLQSALDESSLLIERLDAAGTTPPAGIGTDGTSNPNAGGTGGQGGGQGGGPGAAGNGNPGAGGAKGQGGKPVQPAAEPTPKPTKEPAPARTAAPAPTDAPAKPVASSKPDGPDTTQGDNTQGGKP